MHVMRRLLDILAEAEGRRTIKLSGNMRTVPIGDGGDDEQTMTLTSQGDTKAKLDAFMNDYHTATQQHPFSRGDRILGGTVTTIYPFDGKIHISAIQTLEPGQGHASRAIDWLCQLADEHGVVLDGTAKPFGTDKRYFKVQQLLDFYTRHGFRKTGGNAREGYEIERQPKGG